MYTNNMARLGAFVEVVYPILVPIVIIFFVFWSGLKHDNTLLLPFFASLVLVMSSLHLVGLAQLFLISLPSMLLLIVPVWIAGLLSYPIRQILRRQ